MEMRPGRKKEIKKPQKGPVTMKCWAAVVRDTETFVFQGTVKNGGSGANAAQERTIVRGITNRRPRSILEKAWAGDLEIPDRNSTEPKNTTVLSHQETAESIGLGRSRQLWE